MKEKVRMKKHKLEWVLAIKVQLIESIIFTEKMNNMLEKQN